MSDPKPVPPDDTRQRLIDAYVNAAAIYKRLEEDQGSTDDPYQQRIAALMTSGLKRYEDAGQDEVEEAIALRTLRAAVVLEDVARQSGFVLGIEYVARLLLGAAARNGGAR
jgi:hypothetical protein